MNARHPNYFLDIDDISQKINVQKPYFAFQQLWKDGESLVGSFSAEQPLVYETGPITAGELGRHLAILGSCSAVALHSGPESYYLATKAHFTSKPVRQTSRHEVFYASAKVLSIDKRTLKISAKAWGDEPIAELLCEYMILSPALFKRNFKDYANSELPDLMNSPYQKSISLNNMIIDGMKLEAFAGPLTAQQCAGHFSNFPCWPVAIISQTVFQATGELLRDKYGADSRFYVLDTKLSADKLIGADTTLTFCVEIIEENWPQIKSVTRVYRHDEEVASLINILELINGN